MRESQREDMQVAAVWRATDQNLSTSRRSRYAAGSGSRNAASLSKRSGGREDKAPKDNRDSVITN